MFFFYKPKGHFDKKVKYRKAMVYLFKEGNRKKMIINWLNLFFSFHLCNFAQKLKTKKNGIKSIPF